MPTPVSQTLPLTGARSAESARPDTLGQAAFLRLMTVQMQQQDPFKPADQTQMIAQLAQFSQVAGIGEINAQLGGLGEMNDRLSAITDALSAQTGRLDRLIALQPAPPSSPIPAPVTGA